jgi:hypothetical protein
MKLDKYDYATGVGFMSFEFVSKGPKGEIVKLVQYTKIDERGVYNLGFGDKNKLTGEVDDTIVSNNNDSQKVLATVANTIFQFSEHYPDSWIYLKGSSLGRTRLYRMAIAIYFDELSEIFNFYGLIGNDWYNFEKNVVYDAFLIKRK